MKKIPLAILILVFSSIWIYSQVTWTSRVSGTSLSLESIAFGNGQFVAVGGSPGKILTSPDGITWSKVPDSTLTNPYRTIRDVIYDGKQFIACGDSFEILLSSDGNTWSKKYHSASPPNTNVQNYRYFKSLAYGNSRYVTVGYWNYNMSYDYAQIYKSDLGNPSIWSCARTSSNDYYHSVTFGNNLFAVISKSGSILTSTNGTDWSTSYSSPSDSFNSIHYGNNLFVLCNNRGGIFTTSNCTAIYSQISHTTNSLFDITFGTVYVAVGGRGTILTSPNATDWTVQSSGSTNVLTAVTFGNNMYVAVGYLGTILTSPAELVGVLKGIPKQQSKLQGGIVCVYTIQGKLLFKKYIDNEHYLYGKYSPLKRLPKGSYIVRVPGNISYSSKIIYVE